MTETFTPIPDLPGYSVNARGQVAGKRGLLLHDSAGRVNVKLSGKLKRVFPGELLLLAGWENAEAVAELLKWSADELAKVHARSDALALQLRQAEAEAQKARDRVAELEARFADAALESVDAGKKRAAAKPPASVEDFQALKARCKAAEAHARKIEVQRDNLAAKLLGMRVDLANAKARVKTANCTGGGSPAGDGSPAGRRMLNIEALENL